MASASYAEFLDAAAAAARPRAGTHRRGCRPVHRNDGQALDSQLNLAERIVGQLMSEVGAAEASKRLMVLARKGHAHRHGRAHLDEDGAQPDFFGDDDDGEKEPVLLVSHGFWNRFIRDELNLLPSPARKMRMIRAVKYYAMRAHQGCITRAAYRGHRTKDSKRSCGGSNNRIKAAGLGFALLQYFVDVVRRLQCRADTVLLMTKAKEMREALLDNPSGQWTESNLPKLQGKAGVAWFGRWRKRYGIGYKVTGMKLKVAWRKIKARVFVFLTNVFRLRAFWEVL